MKCGKLVLIKYTPEYIFRFKMSSKEVDLGFFNGDYPPWGTEKEFQEFELESRYFPSKVSYIFSDWTAVVISSDRVACPIHNGTLYLIKYELDIHVLFLKVVYFHFRVLFTLTFFCFRSNGEIISNTFLTRNSFTLSLGLRVQLEGYRCE